jgi:clan AA aspartic protease
MSSGRVEQLHALLPVTFRLRGKPDLSIDFVVDTGFTGFLTLPPQAVSALQLPYLEEASANLADDSQIPVSVHVATIVWNGEVREVRVVATGKRPLLGVGLLEGCELRVQFVAGGGVSLTEL